MSASRLPDGSVSYDSCGPSLTVVKADEVGQVLHIAGYRWKGYIGQAPPSCHRSMRSLHSSQVGRLLYGGVGGCVGRGEPMSVRAEQGGLRRCLRIARTLCDEKPQYWLAVTEVDVEGVWFEFGHAANVAR